MHMLYRMAVPKKQNKTNEKTEKKRLALLRPVTFLCSRTSSRRSEAPLDDCL